MPNPSLMNPVRPWFLLLLAWCAFGNRADAQKLVKRETQLATADFADFVQFVQSLQSPTSAVTPPKSVDDFLLFAPSLVQTTHVDYVPKKVRGRSEGVELFEPQRPITDQEAFRASGSSEEGFAEAWINAMTFLCGDLQTAIEKVEDNYASEAGLVENHLSIHESHFVFDNESHLSRVWEVYTNYTLSEEIEKTISVSMLTENIEYHQGGALPSRLQFLKSLVVNNREDFLEYILGADHPSVLAAMKSALNTEGLSCELIRCQSEGLPVVYFAHVQLLADAAEEQLLRIEALKNDD